MIADKKSVAMALKLFNGTPIAQNTEHHIRSQLFSVSVLSMLSSASLLCDMFFLTPIVPQ